MALSDGFIDVFFIIIIVVLILNVIFLVGSMVYTIVAKTNKIINSRISIQPSILSGGQRPSIIPQTIIYHAMVRLSGGSAAGLQIQTPS